MIVPVAALLIVPSFVTSSLAVIVSLLFNVPLLVTLKSVTAIVSSLVNEPVAVAPVSSTPTLTVSCVILFPLVSTAPFTFATPVPALDKISDANAPCVPSPSFKFNVPSLSTPFVAIKPSATDVIVDVPSFVMSSAIKSPKLLIVAPFWLIISSVAVIVAPAALSITPSFVTSSLAVTVPPALFLSSAFAFVITTLSNAIAASFIKEAATFAEPS